VPEDVDWASKLVLVVEDESFMRRLLVQMLKNIGVGKVLEAENGAEAMKLLTLARTPVDCVLSDLRMPEMDGFALVEAVRTGGEVPNPDVPIVIMSGHSDLESVERAMKSGIQGFVVKPAAQPKVMECLRHAFTG